MSPELPEGPPRPSPLSYAVERIGDRWTILIVDALMAGPRKFGELEGDVTGIAPTVLTKRLRQLENDGIVVARPYTQRPIRLAYELSGPGRDLAGAIALLRDWGASHTGDDSPREHSACGTAVVTRLWCPTCEIAIGDDAVDGNLSF